MQPIPIVSGVIFREPPAEQLIFFRSVSDDDLCAFCRYLWYSPGHDSVCQNHTAGHWPGLEDANGYFQTCPRFAPAE